MKPVPFLLASFAILLASCDRPAIEPSQSLVGAKALPSSRELSEEVISISKSFGVGYGYRVKSHLLSYELRPDNSLVVTHIEQPLDAREIVRATETLQLTKKAADRARQTLWRMRPDKLEGVESDTLPAKCERKLHRQGEAALLYIKEGPKVGVEDDQVGFVSLPLPEECDNENARLARDLLRQVLQSLPPSKVATSFRRVELTN